MVLLLDISMTKVIIVLQRLKAFLPELKRANALLADATPESVNIENVGENSEYIEMVSCFLLDSLLTLQESWLRCV